MSTFTAAELRASQRKRMLKGGTIAFSGRHATLPCVVRDISDTGARLQVMQAAAVPDTFELIVELDGLEVAVEIVWRKVNEVGIRFVGPTAKVPPKRAQTVTIATPSLFKPRPSLRRPDSRLVDASQREVSGAARPTTAVDEAFPIDTLAAGNTALAKPTIPVVVCDDDPDDRLMIEDAFREAEFRHPFNFVENGEELLKYLRGAAPYVDRREPGLVLLDLNMPRMDGRTALMHMKTDASLRGIPVIVMTTSNAEDDIQRTYDLGVSAFIPKPNTQEGLSEVVDAIDKYWLRMVSLPARAPVTAI